MASRFTHPCSGNVSVDKNDECGFARWCHRDAHRPRAAGAARREAERADGAKDEFIAALSHELRTPLNAILDGHPGLPPVQADAQRLQQVVWNLLSNSIKFSPPGSIVTVALSTAGGEVLVSVQDQGDGIQPEFLPRVFERFQQADSSEAQAPAGLGLGLDIARHLVELHSGRLEAHSDGAGMGARFTMHVPAIPAQAVPADLEPA